MSLDPLAHRVARRHMGAVVFRDVPHTSPQLIFSDGGVVTADDVRRVLGDQIRLAAVWFCPSCPSTSGNVVLWEGLAADGTTVSGKLVLHAGVAVDHAVAWAEIVPDPYDHDPPTQAPLHSLKEIARRARALVTQLRGGGLPLHEIAAAVAGIVDVAEGADPQVP